MIIDLRFTHNIKRRGDATDPMMDSRDDGSAVVDERKTGPFAKYGKCRKSDKIMLNFPCSTI